MSMDALNLLKHDHQAVEKLFQSWERSGGGEAGYQFCKEICSELSVHSEIEEQCFYPGVRAMAGLEDMVEHSFEEHAQVKDMCGEIEAMPSGDPRLKERMENLKQAVMQHVHEEERQMFPKVRETCDQQWLLGLGQAMEQQKTQIQARMNAPAAPGEQRVREDVRDPSRRESLR